jgi:D-amino peptidase
MNIFISTDMEGISCVETLSAVMDTETPEYQDALVRLMKDVNVAVEAAFDAGAEKVYVVDGHFHGKNFIPGALDSRATQVWVRDLDWVMKDVDAVVEVGAHAMAGTMNAFLDHTQMSIRIHHYFYNDVRIGEVMQMAVFAGHFGVPIVAVTGDKAACIEAEHFIKNVKTGSVKHSRERNVATCLPAHEAERIIYDTVKTGIENRANVEPIKMELPFEIKVEYNRSDYCDEECRNNPSLERLDAYTARIIKTEIKDYYTGVMI